MSDNGLNGKFIESKNGNQTCLPRWQTWQLKYAFTEEHKYGFYWTNLEKTSILGCASRGCHKEDESWEATKVVVEKMDLLWFVKG